MRNVRWHRGMQCVMAQHFFDSSEFVRGVLPGLVVGKLLFLFGLAGSQFRLAFHNGSSSGFFKKGGESFAGAMEFAADGVRRLLSKRPHLFVAELFISHEKQKQTIFVG